MVCVFGKSTNQYHKTKDIFEHSSRTPPALKVPQSTQAIPPAFQILQVLLDASGGLVSMHAQNVVLQHEGTSHMSCLEKRRLDVVAIFAGQHTLKASNLTCKKMQQSIHLYILYMHCTCIASFDPSNMSIWAIFIIPIPENVFFCVQTVQCCWSCRCQNRRNLPHGLCRKI